MANHYIYEGPVYKFDTVVEDRWHGETYAVSASKAKSNLEYQCKKRLGLLPSMRVSLPGKIICDS